MNTLRAGLFVMSMTAAANAPAQASDDIFLNGYEQFTLTIGNVLDWCSIKEDGGASYMASAVLNQGKVVNLSAEPISGFIWGHWTGTDGDSGSGDENKVTTVTMDSDRAVIACCPFPNGTGC